MKSLARVFVVVMFAVAAVAGQHRIISLEEFSEHTNSAAERAREASRRELQIVKVSENGITVSTTEVLTEVIKGETTRLYQRTRKVEESSDLEMIVIGADRYLRENGGAWKLEEKNPFRKLEVMVGPLPPPGMRQYSVEAMSIEGLRFQKYGAFFVNVVKGQLTYSLREIWIGENDLMHREDVTSGNLSPKSIDKQSSTLFEYPKNLKIEAPIR